MRSLDSAEVSASVEKLAEHFDKTDTTDMSWEVVTEAQIERPELEQVFVRLPKEDVAVLRRRAARLGIGYHADPFGALRILAESFERIAPGGSYAWSVIPSNCATRAGRSFFTACQTTSRSTRK